MQRGIESYVVHMDVGSVAIKSPSGEQRIAALYRGNGPREGADSPWDSFDGYLQGMAVERGARVVRRLITDVEWRDDRPWLLGADGEADAYDLVTVASGVNSNFLKLLEDLPAGIQPPKTTRTYICEFRSTPEEVLRVLGNQMHVFLLTIPRLEFAAIIPKGEFVTVVMLGDELDQELVHAFLRDPVVQKCFPTDATPCVCSCSPLINMGARKRPFGDRVVLIGDSGVTRLYKDGIGAAFRTAKAAASTAVVQGVSARAFERNYWPTCRGIAHDNAIGKVIFGTTTLFKMSKISRRGILRMAQQGAGESGRPPAHELPAVEHVHRQRSLQGDPAGDAAPGVPGQHRAEPRRRREAYKRQRKGDLSMGKGALGKLYADGEAIVRQGEVGDCMYVVQSGRVEVVQATGTGEQHLAFLETGDFFGEMAVFEKETRSATVRASGEARVLKVDKKTLLRRIKEDPLLAVNLLQTMSHRIRDLNAEVALRERAGS